MFWDDIRAGLSVIMFIMLILILTPSSVVFGLYLMNKVFFPQLTPACEVRK